jgi:hypothetical protein
MSQARVRDKLTEEVAEFLASGSDPEELADILEDRLCHCSRDVICDLVYISEVTGVFRFPCSDSVFRPVVTQPRQCPVVGNRYA